MAHNSNMLYPISKPIPKTAEDLIGYIDYYGQLVVPEIYIGGSFFFDGLAAVMGDDYKTGFIDERGALVIPHKYQGLAHYCGGICTVGYINPIGMHLMGVIDHSGNWIMEPQPFLILSSFNEGLAAASVDGEIMGYVDMTGSFVIEPQFEGAHKFQSGLAAVCCKGHWGYIDRKGRVIIPFQFDGPRAQTFTCGLAGVCYQGLWGFIDNSGEWVVKPCFEDVKRFSEGYAPVKRNGKWGLISLFGEVQIEFQYDELGEPRGGFVNATLDNKAGFISTLGTWIIQPEYQYCYPFFGELAVVKNKEKSYSYIKKSGEIIWTSEPFAVIQSPPFIE
jgi:hypothetical protein